MKLNVISAIRKAAVFSISVLILFSSFSFVLKENKYFNYSSDLSLSSYCKLISSFPQKLTSMILKTSFKSGAYNNGEYCGGAEKENTDISGSPSFIFLSPKSFEGESANKRLSFADSDKTMNSFYFDAKFEFKYIYVFLLMFIMCFRGCILRARGNIEDSIVKYNRKTNKFRLV